VPSIAPFPAWRYSPQLRADLGQLIAPPYDVISDERRISLEARHPHNIVHVDLPRPRAGEEPYTAAARMLRDWTGAGVLARDETGSLYACEQRFRSADGAAILRRGFFARMRLEAFDARVVLPHERTLESPRADRQRLLAATRTHLSAVFMLHPDPAGTVSRLLAGAFDGSSPDEGLDDDGVLNRLVRLEPGGVARTIVEQLANEWALIADGHHRYESALAFRDERRAAGRPDAEQVLVYLCSMADPGLRIRPIHRLVKGLAYFDAARFRARLEEFFSLEPMADGDALRTALQERTDRAGTFGLTFRGGGGFWLAGWKEGRGLDTAEMSGIPDPLRRLDVILLHRLVLEGILGISTEAQARQENLEYVKDDAELLGRMSEGRYELGILLNPTRMDQVVEVSRQGLRLPQKSTFFHPKVPTGLVLDGLDE